MYGYGEIEIVVRQLEGAKVLRLKWGVVAVLWTGRVSKYS